MMKKFFSGLTALSVIVALAGASAPKEASAMKCQDTSSQCGLITGGGGGGGGPGGGGGGGVGVDYPKVCYGCHYHLETCCWDLPTGQTCKTMAC
jgi:hypothetical protein